MKLKHRLKTFSLVTASLLASVSFAHAAALKNFYFSGYMGLNEARLSQAANAPEKSVSLSGALGFKLGSRWRIEGELSQRDHNSEPVNFNESDAPPSGKFKSWSGLVNVYHDFGSPGKIQPFVGAGIGLVTTQTGDTQKDNGSFAWQLGGGVKYNFDSSLSFSSAYRFLDSAALAPDSAGDDTAHELHVGLSYKLPVRPLHHPRGPSDTGAQ